MGSLPLPILTARQLPTRPIGKKSKYHNNNNGNGQAGIEKFLVKMVNPQASPIDIPPAQIDDDDEYDIQFEDVQNALPDGILQQYKA